ncbi:MAG: hypothetical protein Q4G07_10945, partial [Oscillospiraceae bacterium]|nr:hypothetical protein [Oscillospiraceae bacterium]
NAGLGQLILNNDELNAGAAAIFDAILANASSQLNAALGGGGVLLTKENYSAVLGGMLEQLGEENVYQQVRAGVEAQVKTDANRAAAKQSIQMNVAANILVRSQAAAAGNTLTDEEAKAAAEALLRDPAGQTQLEAALGSPDMQQALAEKAVFIDQQTEAALDNMVLEQMSEGQAGYIALQQALAKAGESGKMLNQLLAQLDQVKGFCDGLALYTASAAQLYTQGTAPLAAGASDLRGGASALSGGAQELAGGAAALADGTSQLLGGANTLSEGLITYNKEGIQQLLQSEELDAVQALSDVGEALKESALAYQGFSGAPENAEGTVKFVYKVLAPAVQKQDPQVQETAVSAEKTTFWQRVTALFS